MKRILSIILSIITLISALSISATAFATDKYKIPTKVTVHTNSGECYDFWETFSKSGDKITKVVSSNPKIVEVAYSDDTFRFHGKELGKATVTVTINKKITKKINVIVNKIDYIILIGDSRTYPKINGKTTAGWKSSNSNIIKTEKNKFTCKSAKKAVNITKTVNGVKYTATIHPFSKLNFEKKLIKDLSRQQSKKIKSVNIQSIEYVNNLVLVAKVKPYSIKYEGLTYYSNGNCYYGFDGKKLNMLECYSTGG